MFTRLAKMLLLAGIALYCTLVVFNNLTDFSSNYEFIGHVLSMDTTIPGNHGMWRALTSPTMHLASYWLIIAWEFVTAILAWWALANLIRVLHKDARVFNAKKAYGGGRADALAADVARCVSGCRRGVVPDVAIAYLEWSGRSVSHVRHRRIRIVAAFAA